MAVRFQCSCGKKLKASDEKIGKKVLCSGCGKSIRVPDADDTPRKAAPTAAVSSSSTSASHIASDLLKKTDTEVKSRMPTEDDPRAESEVSIALTVRSLLTATLPGAAITLVVVGAAYFLSSTIFSPKIDRPELGTVSGVIKLDGVPLAGAQVAFVPIPQGGELQTDNLGASYGLTNAEGKYELFYVKDVPGAVLGPHKVQIQARGSDGRQIVPPAYNRLSKLVAEVKPGDNPNFDFPVFTMPQ